VCLKAVPKEGFSVCAAFSTRLPAVIMEVHTYGEVKIAVLPALSA
jgi:hypothetical protein